MKKMKRMVSAEAACAAEAEQYGLEVIEVSLDTESTGRYLRIYIDKPEGISLDDCERFHKAVKPLMEPYDFDCMEFSSPGIDRPLRSQRDYERHLGDEVEIHLYRPMDGTKILKGILAGLEKDEILLQVAGDELRIPRKTASLVKPVVDMEGIEEVDLSGTDVVEYPETAEQEQYYSD